MTLTFLRSHWVGCFIDLFSVWVCLFSPGFSEVNKGGLFFIGCLCHYIPRVAGRCTKSPSFSILHEGDCTLREMVRSALVSCWLQTGCTSLDLWPHSEIPGSPHSKLCPSTTALPYEVQIQWVGSTLRLWIISAAEWGCCCVPWCNKGACVPEA